jgi:hypothetical protein
MPRLAFDRKDRHRFPNWRTITSISQKSLPFHAACLKAPALWRYRDRRNGAT